MAIMATPKRFETMRDGDGNVTAYFFAGLVRDDVHGELYREYWIDGAELAALPAEHTDPAKVGTAECPRFQAIYALLTVRVAELHAAWIAELTALAARPGNIVRTPEEMAAFPPVVVVGSGDTP